MEDENQTLEANPSEEVQAQPENVPSVEGTQNDVNPQTTTPSDALTLAEINALTKHSYSNIDEARKGLENLRKAVGQKEIPVQDPNLLTEVETLKRQVKESSFYAEHPELKPHKDFLAKFGDPEVALKDPVVKKAVDALSREESSSLKSNPRIAQVNTSYQEDFEKAKTTGQWTEFLKKHKGFEIS